MTTTAEQRQAFMLAIEPLRAIVLVALLAS
jgi:hypothetical protein